MPELSGGRDKILDVCSQLTGTLQIAPLIFRCWPFGITTIFSNTMRCAIRICSSFSIETQVLQGFHQQAVYCTQLDMELALLKPSSHMFCKFIPFYQMTSYLLKESKCYIWLPLLE